MKNIQSIFTIVFCFLLTPLNGKENPQRIPFEAVRGQIIVTAELGGLTRRFLFDTGSKTCITDSLARELGIGTSRQRRIYDSGGETQRTDYVELPAALRLGDTEFRNIRALILHDNEFLRCFGIDGILGPEIFHQMAVGISMQRQELTIWKKLPGRELRKAHRLPMSMIEGSPYVKIKFRGGGKSRREWVLFDTGAYNIELLPRMYDKFESSGLIGSSRLAVGHASYGVLGFGAEGVIKRGAVPEVKIGRAALRNVPVHVARGSRSLLGSVIMQYGVVFLDFRNMDFYYLPNPTDGIVPTFSTANQLNVVIVHTDGAYRVGSVWDEGLRSLISPGDEVLSMGDVKATNLMFCEFLSGNLCLPLGTPIKIRTRSGTVVDIPFQFAQ